MKSKRDQTKMIKGLVKVTIREKNKPKGTGTKQIKGRKADMGKGQSQEGQER